MVVQIWDNFNLEVKNTKLRLKEKVFAYSFYILSSGSNDRVLDKGSVSHSDDEQFSTSSC